MLLFSRCPAPGTLAQIVKTQPMQKNPERRDRRHFVYGIGAIAALAGLRALFLPKKDVISCGPATTGKTHRMLTQDGTLVEVDDAVLSEVRKRITDEELRNFVQRTPNPNRSHETE